MDSTKPETVTLKNGASEVKGLVTVTMLMLHDLLQDKPIVFYELVMKARDPNHKFFGCSGDNLKAVSLVQGNGQIHDSIRNIVLSAVKGEGLQMTLSSVCTEQNGETLYPDR